MSLTQALFKKMRRYGRKIFRPMTMDEAAEKKEILSIAYFLSSVVLFCYANYIYLSLDDPKAKLDSEEQVRLFLDRNEIIDESVKVHRFKNFKKVEDLVIHQDEEHLNERIKYGRS